PLTRGMTVRDLVFKAGGLTKDAYLPVATLYRTDPVSKETIIRTFNLGRALEGDSEEDTVLQDLDHVVVHSAYEFAPVRRVHLSGMVSRPGPYPYAGNMRVRDLILASGGLTEEAYQEEAEVVRAEVVNGEVVQTRTIPFSLVRAMAGDEDANLPLEPRDRVFVKTIPDWRESRQVVLAGEVLFPGVYHVAKGESLSSVLNRAGGFTSEAYLRGAVFTRESARQLQQQRLDELRERLQQQILRVASQEVQGALSAEDVEAQKQFLIGQQALVQKLRETRATGRVVVRLLPLEKMEGTEWDIPLEDGDRLTVPSVPQTVSVVGQVYNPTSLLWETNRRSVQNYLFKTGGPTPDADAKDIYVVRADGTVVSSKSLGEGNWWNRGGIHDLDLYPGDTVLVPEKVLRVNYLRGIRDISQVLYQIAVTAGVAVALF
ncbi:MAG: SLBB domain-containing protein, partial [Deferrisomatales bacterium]